MQKKTKKKHGFISYSSDLLPLNMKNQKLKISIFSAGVTFSDISTFSVFRTLLHFGILVMKFEFGMRVWVALLTIYSRFNELIIFDFLIFITADSFLGFICSLFNHFCIRSLLFFYGRLHSSRSFFCLACWFFLSLLIQNGQHHFQSALRLLFFDLVIFLATLWLGPAPPV